MVKNPPANAGEVRDEGSIPGSEDPLKEEMAAHSCILAWKNPMDRGAWWATVQRVAKSQTGLSMHAGTRRGDLNFTGQETAPLTPAQGV